MIAFVKMHIVAATCLLFVCAIHAVDRETENAPTSFHELVERSRRSVSRPYPYRHHYNPIEPPPWNDVAEHVPDSRIDGYRPTYWPFVKAVADKPPQPPQPTTYRQTGSVYVPVFDAADFGRSPWHAPPPHRLAPEDDHEDYHHASLNAYRVDAEPKAAVRMLAAAAAANVFGGLLSYRPSDGATPRDDGTPPATAASPETFDGRPAVIVLTVPVVETAASENATAAADDDAGLLLLLVDRQLENVAAELRQTDARTLAHLTVDNISAEFPSDDSPTVDDGADRTSAYAVNEYDNDVA